MGQWVLDSISPHCKCTTCFNQKAPGYAWIQATTFGPCLNENMWWYMNSIVSNEAKDNQERPRLSHLWIKGSKAFDLLWAEWKLTLAAVCCERNSWECNSWGIVREGLFVWNPVWRRHSCQRLLGLTGGELDEVWNLRLMMLMKRMRKEMSCMIWSTAMVPFV